MSRMTLEEAKSLVAGPLGDEMAKFALRFCKPLYFGPPPSRGHPGIVNSATASLLRFGDDLLAVTCSHVIDGCRRKLAEDHRCLFAIANCYFDDPLGQLVAEDSAIDAAVFRVTMEQADQITRNSAGIGEAFYEVSPSSVALVKVGDFVAFGGFPGMRAPACFIGRAKFR
jgi:hypothetical protein